MFPEQTFAPPVYYTIFRGSLRACYFRREASFQPPPTLSRPASHHLTAGLTLDR